MTGAGDGSHQVLAGSTGQAFQLVVHAIPAHVAATLVVSAPPERREDTPIKLFFTVDDLAAATAVIRQLGGDVAPRGWRGPGFSALDAHDPEGNVFQLRERVAAP